MKSITLQVIIPIMVFSSFSNNVLCETQSTFHGTLVKPPPCTINDDNSIDVDFGQRLGIDKIDGQNYRMPLNYSIECNKGTTNGSNKWILNLTLTGSVSGFDSSALITNMENLGVRIYIGDLPFPPNKSISINPDAPPKLNAVPVKKSGSALSEGAFESWATLQASYL